MLAMCAARVDAQRFVYSTAGIGVSDFTDVCSMRDSSASTSAATSCPARSVLGSTASSSGSANSTSHSLDVHAFVSGGGDESGAPLTFAMSRFAQLVNFDPAAHAGDRLRFNYSYSLESFALRTNGIARASLSTYRYTPDGLGEVGDVQYFYLVTAEGSDGYSGTLSHFLDLGGLSGGSLAFESTMFAYVQEGGFAATAMDLTATLDGIDWVDASGSVVYGRATFDANGDSEIRDSVAPEPASIVLLATGLCFATVGGARRRRKRAA